MIKINNVLIQVVKKFTNEELIELAKKKICKKYHINSNQIKEIGIIKKSIDARYDVCYNLSLYLKLDKNLETTIINKYPVFTKYQETQIIFNNTQCPKKFLIVGAGPSGLFNALSLMELGHEVIVIEQGEPVEQRSNSIYSFWENGKLNEYSNVQFGEGGAGTFSDGKLNTNVNTIFNQYVLHKFVEFGASKEILIDTKPHIGTDILKVCLKNLRTNLLTNNVKIYFNTQFIDYKNNENGLRIVVKDLITNQFAYHQVDYLVLAVGHSAKTTYQTLEKKIILEPKPFAMGLRIEHYQQAINESLYKEANKYLPAASYKLVTHVDDKRTVYSFCMCPGGEVVNASSEVGKLVINGMSYSKRDSRYANSALLVNVDVDDYYVNSPLDGLKFQEKYESKAYQLLNGKVPIQYLDDFLENKVSTKLLDKPSMIASVGFGNLRELLPSFVSDALIKAMPNLEKKIKGFTNNPLLYGIETRSSSPIRIKRNEFYQSSNNKVFPIGEGAGYSGGIMTSAIDGIKCALAIEKLLNEK